MDPSILEFGLDHYCNSEFGSIIINIMAKGPGEMAHYEHFMRIFTVCL